MVRTGHNTIIGAAVGLIAALIVVASASAAGNTLPTKGQPSKPMTDQETQQLVERNRANNLQYLKAFKLNHVDPKALKVGRIPTAGVGPGTLSATRNVPLVIYGHVDSTEFLADPDNEGMLPVASSTVTVMRVLATRGVPVPVGQITVLQHGGPVWQQGADVIHGTGGILAELETDPLLLPGQDVVLFLRHPRTITQLWTQDVWMSAVGPKLDIQQGVVMHTHARFAQEVLGKSIDQLEQQISSQI